MHVCLCSALYQTGQTRDILWHANHVCSNKSTVALSQLLIVFFSKDVWRAEAPVRVASYVITEHWASLASRRHCHRWSSSDEDDQRRSRRHHRRLIAETKKPRLTITSRPCSGITSESTCLGECNIAYWPFAFSYAAVAFSFFLSLSLTPFYQIAMLLSIRSANTKCAATANKVKPIAS